MSDILRDFDNKNEIPKVKLNLPKFDFSHLTEAVRNMNSVFENMTKDIRERQDNAMAMEFTKCIGELMKKNGVTQKITEYTRDFETENTFETRYGVSIDELDFSEHDMVFEDKIAKLELKLQRVLSQNKDHEDTIACYVEKTEELKQRIAELESKETENPTKINLNDRIKVKLTPLGAEIYYHQYDELNKKIKDNGGTQLELLMPQIDKDGYTEFQLWHFMELYGEHIGMCKKNVIEPLDIIIAE